MRSSRALAAIALDVPALMAGVLLSTLPLVILFIFMRKQVMNSLGGIVAR